MERVAIVGTAPSWKDTPWQDAGLTILSLNDAYQLPGFERADGWYDLHPLDHFYHPPKPTDGGQVVIYSHQIPPGHYVRPAGHLDWLATQPMPVWLAPDHALQHPLSATWPNAKAFPKAAIEAAFGTYFTSTPAWMLAHAILQGAREVHIYGIHLATESEYLEQRANFEFLIGCVLGRGKRTITVTNGLRRFETSDGIIVLPEASPVLSSPFQYAFEPSPRRKLEPFKWALHKATVKRERTIHALKNVPWYRPWTVIQEPHDDGQISSRRVLTSTLQQELWHYEALVADCQDQLTRASHGG